MDHQLAPASCFPGEHLAQLRALYASAGDMDSLRQLEEEERKCALGRAAPAQRVLAVVPVVAAVVAVGFSLAMTQEPLTNWIHDARVVGVIAFPWFAKSIALQLLS